MTDEKDAPSVKDGEAPDELEEEEKLSSNLDDGEKHLLDGDDDEDDLGIDPLANAEDAIDPELLALADEKPAAKWHRPLIMVAVCVLIGIMMYWFRYDVVYFFAPSETMDLGEAHDITFDDSWENRLVQLDGVPLAPQNMNPDPRCGMNQGFPTYQRRFLCRGYLSAIPVMGRPEHDLIIQRYMMRQLRVHFTAPEGREEEILQEVMRQTQLVGAVHAVKRTRSGELGDLIVDIEGTSGQTDLSAVSKSIAYRIESSVAGVTRVRVERVRREVPGEFEGRLVRLGDLGSRFASVAEYLNDCTNYPVDEDTWVLLDGSEAGNGSDMMGLCYGQKPRQYWPYLMLFIFMGGIFILNIYLLVRFFMGLRKSE